MKTIEDEIKQNKQIASVYEKLVVNILFTNNWVVAEHNKLLKKHELTIQQYNVLRILRGQYPNAVNVNGITERMIDRMSNVSRLIDKLILKKLVQRSINPNDKRVMDVKINDNGLNVLEQIDSDMATWETNFHTLSHTEALHLNLLLDKLRAS